MRRLAPILLLFLVLASCREPRSSERFIGGAGPYVFRVDMSDTTVRYRLDFYTRVDAASVPGSVLLNLRWTAPSGKSRSEQAYLPLEGRQTFFSRQVYQAYRDGVVPFEPGVWTLTVTAAAPPEGFRGLGLVVKKEDPWDTEN